MEVRILKIIRGGAEKYRQTVRELFWEYMAWNHLMVQRELGIDYDVRAVFEQDMAELHKYAPPAGQLLLAQIETSEPAIAGCACLRKIGAGVGEVKRMYVRPAYRGRGVGRSLLETLIQEACQIGYSQIRLDCARFLTDAQALYRSIGFRAIAPYTESEIPELYWSDWVFMEKTIDTAP